MEPGSLVVLGVHLSKSDIAELEGAGYPIPQIGKTIYEVKSGPFLTVCEGKSTTAVTFWETGNVEWSTWILLEVDEPKVIDLQTLLSV